MLSSGGMTPEKKIKGKDSLPPIQNDNYGNIDGTPTGGNNYIAKAPNTAPAASPPP